MLFFGGGGGLVNMSYGMNALVHNTSWVTAHFHLIFGGTVVIMYFAIAYAIWPQLTGRAADRSLEPRSVCSSGCGSIGMLVMTLPWHWLGLNGQWRRVAHFDYTDPLIAWWGPWVVVSLVGGLLLLASALLFVATWRGCTARRRAHRAAADALCARAAPAEPGSRCRSMASPCGTCSCWC